MKLRSVTTITALAVLAVSLFTGAASADASIITMQFTGTVMPPGAGPVFGESGSSTPFDFSMTYDTSKGAELAFHDGDPGDDDLWAYSAAGITAVSLTFGTKTWTLDDLQPARELGTTADFWTNSDLTLAAPTALQIYFRDGDGSLDLGNVYLRGGQALFKSVEIHDNSQGGVDGYMIGTYTLTTSVAGRRARARVAVVSWFRTSGARRAPALVEAALTHETAMRMGNSALDLGIDARP